MEQRAAEPAPEQWEPLRSPWQSRPARVQLPRRDQQQLPEQAAVRVQRWRLLLRLPLLRVSARARSPLPASSRSSHPPAVQALRVLSPMVGLHTAFLAQSLMPLVVKQSVQRVEKRFDESSTTCRTNGSTSRLWLRKTRQSCSTRGALLAARTVLAFRLERLNIVIHALNGLISLLPHSAGHYSCGCSWSSSGSIQLRTLDPPSSRGNNLSLCALFRELHGLNLLQLVASQWQVPRNQSWKSRMMISRSG